MQRRIVFRVAALLMAAGSAAAGEIGFLEDFSLAEDRTEALRTLIPGSEDYYYYHCLHYQQLQQFGKIDELLKLWVERYKDSPRLREVQNRQALLTYEAQPQQTLQFLQQRLDLRFDHQRIALGAKPDLGTRLDPAILNRDRLAEMAFQRHPNLAGFEDTALAWLAERPLNAEQRRHLLERLTRPDVTALPKLVAEDLAAANSQPFGSMTIHRQLLRTQLDELAGLKPELLQQPEFVSIYLSKLSPSDDVNWQEDEAEREAYLTRLWEFVKRLAPAHNSLKAHVLYQRLVHDRARGIYDKERFLAYLQLPRNAAYVEPRFLQAETSRGFLADLNAPFENLTRCPPVGDDEGLVRSYLQHYFLEETTTKPYETWIRADYLRELFAETKIVAGLGDAEQWYSLLPAEKYQALKERIDLDFAPTNKRYFAADEPVQLDLFVKNVRTLIVKVFEINAQNYYRQQQREVNSDINLDGLVANDEQTHQYSEAPLRRVARHFEFPALTKPGVYVVDFIGNGVSSRAVVRKGKLQYLVRTSTAGHVFRVSDDQNLPAADATLWLAGHEYLPDEQGQIVVPFTANPGPQAIVLSRGGFSSLDVFQHEAENYQLVAGIYVDRESLLQRKAAQVVIRPALLLNGSPVTLSVLEDVRLVITSVDHDGVASTKEVKDFKLFEDRESVYSFQTPPRLAQIQFALQARVQNLSQNKKIDLAASEAFGLNEIDKTEKTETLHLAKVGNDYVLELRGKTGEAKPDRPVQLSIKQRDFCEPVNIGLQTDATGQIALGSLAEIASLTASSPDGTAHTWNLLRDRHSYPRTLHGAAGEPIAVPLMGPDGEPKREALSLLELRGETFVQDRFEALVFENGLLRIQGLPRGDYDLLLKDSGHRVRLRVAEGALQLGHVLGAARRLELRGQQPLQIAAVDAGPEQLRVQLRNASKFSRVHVFATRYAPPYSAFDRLSRVADPEPYVYPATRPLTLYVSGRNIGDEYRYIIDRKYAAKFPGNMLERPSVLLNPWPLRSTEAGRQEAAEGEAFGAQPAPAAAAPTQAETQAAAPAVQSDFANLDFLSEAAAVLLNQVPDEQGAVAIPRTALGANQQLHIVAVDPQTTAYRTLALPELATTFLDLRLARGLDPKAHFTQQKRISLVAAGEKFVLPDITTSRFEVYDSLARVYTLYSTLSGDAKLAEFRFLLTWPKLSVEEKRTLYSKYACHELNFFLSRKDPAFFAEVAKPYLTNKLHKTFVDEWLVGMPLDRHLAPLDYSRLNLVERILLSQRVAADRGHTTRHVRDLVEILPPNLDRFNHLFLTALLGSALETSDRLGVAAAKEQAEQNLSRGALGQMAAGMGMGGRAAGAAPGAAAAPPAPAVQVEELEARMDLLVKESAKEEKPAVLARRAFGRKAAEGKPADGRRDEAGRPMEAAADKEAGQYFFADGALRERVRQLYQKLDKTQEWAENNYYQLPIEQQSAELVPVSRFWKDCVEHDPAQPFLSVNLAESSGNFTEMMLALALLDLPFESAEHKTEFDGTQMTLTAASGMVVFHEEIRPATQPEQGTPILVSQNFFRQDDRYAFENGERRDKFVSDEFLIHTVYGCQVVVTNPTSTPQKLDVLLQVPVGALPVLNAQFTRSVAVDLQPYNTLTLEYHFYFPAPGSYAHYPVHVAKNEQLLATAAPVALNVVAEPSRIDRASWEYVSQNGTGEEVLQYLRDNNLQRTDLEKIAFRMQDPAFFTAALELLTKRHAYNHTLWSYGIKHNTLAAVREYLQHADGFVSQCGEYLDSPLLTIDPVARKAYQHLDYRPLVNDRVHPLGRRRQIVNERLYEQYQRLLKILSYRRELEPDDLLSVTYYLLLQDRVEEALRFFAKVDPEKLATRLQYDYFAAYLAMCRGDLETARKLTDRWLKYPVDRWRNAFAAVDQQLEEIAGASAAVVDREDRGQAQTGLAASEPGFDFLVEAKRIRVNYQNLKQLRVDYYLMDIELLFSRNPFVQQYSSQFAHIRPNRSDAIQLPEGQKTLEFPLPEELLNRNVLVEVTGGGQTKSQAYYSNALSVQVIENYGQVRVTHQATGKPVGKVYVKVYAALNDGSLKFYKDGYTDLRGRFDYTSLNTNELDNVSRFALLVLSDDFGAVVREAAPPKR